MRVSVLGSQERIERIERYLFERSGGALGVCEYRDVGIRCAKGIGFLMGKGVIIADKIVLMNGY